MKKTFLFLLFLLCGFNVIYAQVSINTDNSDPDPAAMFEVKSTNKGILPPRMTTAQMNGIVTPPAGLLVYNIDIGYLYWFNGLNWKRFNESNFTETDPVFAMHVTNSITLEHIINWNTAYLNNISSVTSTLPLSLSLNGNTLIGAITMANSSQSGYLNAADWTTFNNKQNTLNFSNLTEVGSSVLNILGGTNAVHGLGTTIQVRKADPTESGYLSAADWNTFFNKQDAITKGALMETGSSVLTITNGNNAVLGTGTFLHVRQSNNVQSGYLSATDWNTFNNKQNAITTGNLTSNDIAVSGGVNSVLGNGTSLMINKGNLIETGSSVLIITGGNNSVLGTGTSLQVKQATASQPGFLTVADWNSFNSKVSSQWVNNGNKLYYQAGNVGIGTSSPSSSALMDLNSSTSGILIPRMTRDQRNSITNPADGLMVYCTNCGSHGALSMFTNSSWLTFSPCSISAPGQGTTTIYANHVVWNWQPVAGAAGYRWNTTNLYEQSLDLGSATSYTEAGLPCGQTTTRYIWTYSNCSESEATLLTAYINPTAPGYPTAGSHVPGTTQIVWNWSPPGGTNSVIGYLWNTVNNSQTASNIGNVTSYTETGLTCVTGYTRYIWAYNGCGTSYAVVLSHSTVACCGSNITINHVAGVVAPVTKTVTYGTVTNLPGETSKCWTTSNLGSDHQASSVNDATEASAGWYWQFNLKQGYKHDGTNRTPNTSWISTINENSNWISANDPCTIELGVPWRIPTFSEWQNVKVSGNWGTWNDPWNSLLKIHAAGYVNPGLGDRGVTGYYMSSEENYSEYIECYGLITGADGVMVSNNHPKAFAHSLRCIRDGL